MTIVNLSRAFLDTNGVTQNAEADIAAPQGEQLPQEPCPPAWPEIAGHRGPERKPGPAGGLLPEGAFRAVRRQHRRGHGADALLPASTS